MTPDLERLRRFALGAALVLISYSAAGIELNPGAQVTLFGLPFLIHRPELLPLGLALASVYGLARFYYYGLMLSHSPQRRRKDLLHRLHAEGGRGTYAGSVIFGPAHYCTTPLIHDKAVAEASLHELIAVFPKVWKIRAHGMVEPVHITDEDGEERTLWEANVTIPFSCRLAALVQDLDYTAPVWLNMGALTLAAVTMLPL
jgi:hypothetical protein